MYLQLNPNKSGGMWAHPPPCGVGFLQNLRTTYTESRVSSEKEKSFLKNSHLLQKKKFAPKISDFSAFRSLTKNAKIFASICFAKKNSKFCEIGYTKISLKKECGENLGKNRKLCKKI